jgi:hypothetical protein
MSKKQSNNSPITGIRLDKNDQKAMKFVQEKLSQPGLELSKSDVLRRALHALANMLHSQEDDRRKGNGS